MSRNYESLNLKLYKDEDKDIIEFLEDKPKAYFVKRALRVYMNDIFENMPTKDAQPRKKEEEKPKDDGDKDELEGLF